MTADAINIHLRRTVLLVALLNLGYTISASNLRLRWRLGRFLYSPIASIFLKTHQSIC